MSADSLKTPCVGICSTGIAGNVCRGCKRFAHEVIYWNRYSDDECLLVWRRLSQLRDLAAGAWIEVRDVSLLRMAMTQRRLRTQLVETDLGIACDLLRGGVSSFAELADCGVKAYPADPEETPTSIWVRIETRFLELSQVHHQRYFQPYTKL